MCKVLLILIWMRLVVFIIKFLERDSFGIGGLGLGKIDRKKYIILW